MRLTENIFLVGSGGLGFHISNVFDCHVYLIQAGGEMGLIDSGVGINTNEIVENIRAEGLNPSKIKTIFVTHYHSDHIGGLADLKKVTAAKIIASKDAAQLIEEGNEEATGVSTLKKLYRSLSDYQLKPCKVDIKVQDGDTMRIGKYEITAIATPGHCMGHMSYLLKAENGNILFSGDCVFYGGKIMLQSTPDCNIQDYARSLSKLRKLSIDALLPGHMCIVLRGGHSHVVAAAQVFEQCGIPPNVTIPSGVFK